MLLIDDDQFIWDVVSAKLSDENTEVHVAKNAAEGLAKLDEIAFDVLLLDLDLPDTPGLQILKQLKEKDKLKNLDVVIFSNNDTQEMKDTTKALGAKSFFVKASINPDDLKQQIEIALQ